MRLRTRIHQPALLAVSTVITLLGVFFIVVGLNDADKYSSVIGGLVTVAGAVPPLMAWIRQPSDSASPPDEHAPHAGQQVRRSAIGGDSFQIRGVRGSVRIGPAPSPGMGGDRPPSETAAPPSASPGAQLVTDSKINGSSVQIDHVSGDVDIHQKTQ